MFHCIYIYTEFYIIYILEPHFSTASELRLSRDIDHFPGVPKFHFLHNILETRPPHMSQLHVGPVEISPFMLVLRQT